MINEDYVKKKMKINFARKFRPRGDLLGFVLNFLVYLNFTIIVFYFKRVFFREKVSL